ncbi:MAG: hypothetical protein IMY79_03720 [Chloroflexi bacterium]|nr:hypothetical protein [Chloroflexota bacterium]MCK4843627.1 hypothetical protein [Dehalococcoidia bacterium]
MRANPAYATICLYTTAHDWQAGGVDPHKNVVFVQSHVPQAEKLHALFSMLTPLSWLVRVSTFEEKARMQPRSVSIGLVDHPVLMPSSSVL